MALLTARLSILAAVALASVAQVVVAPASCCLLRAALTPDAPCCHQPAVASAPRSCCHGSAPEAATVSTDDSHHSPSSGECLWCSAGPEIGSQDRVLPPAPDLAAALPVAVVEPMSAFAPAVAAEEAASEPFHRTAVAMCSWLCVWRK